MRNSTRIKQSLTRNINQIHKHQKTSKNNQNIPRLSQNNSISISPEQMTLTSTAFYTPNYQHSHSPIPQQGYSKLSMNLKYYRKLYENQDKSNQNSTIEIKKAFSERQLIPNKFKQRQNTIQKLNHGQDCVKISNELNSKLKMVLSSAIKQKQKFSTTTEEFKNNLKSQEEQNKQRKFEKNQKLIKKFQQKIDTLNKQLKVKNEQISKLSQENKKKQIQINELSSQLDTFYNILRPYTNNLNLLTVQYDALIQALKSLLSGSLKLKKEVSLKINSIQNERQIYQEKQKNCREVSMLKKKIQEAKFNQLKVISLETQNENLRDQTHNYQNQIKKLEYELELSKKMLQESTKHSKYRQLHDMCNQELYTYKIKCRQLKNQNQKHEATIKKYKTKISMMTSLIGYGALTQIQSCQKFDLENFKEQFMKYDSFLEVGLTNDVYGLGDLEIGKFKLRQSQTVKDYILKEYSENLITCRKLAAPNYMIFHQQKALVDHISQNKQNIIKSDFITLLRTILDNKYIDFCLHKSESIKFQDFVYSYLQSYKLIISQKKIYFNIRNIVSWQQQMIKLNFLMNLFDKKIDNLPQIVTFRQFLLRNVEQDEILFYLSCRDKLFKGPQLQNFINCSDFITYITFDHARKIVMLILEKYNRKVKDLVFSHLNSKKILKNNIQLIKPSYVLRVLLQIYRKSKVKKIFKLKDAFQNIFNFNKVPLMKFSHFRALLQRNYSFLTKSEVCHMYRITVTLFQSQKCQKNVFFQSFYATCGQQLFTRQIIEFNTKLEEKIQAQTQLYQDINNLESEVNTSFSTKLRKVRQKSIKSKKSTERAQIFESDKKGNQVQFLTVTQKNKRNCLFQLYPDCVYRLGNEKINKCYVELLKKDHVTNIQIKSQLIIFLSKTLYAHKMRKTTTQKQNHLIENQLQQIVLSLINVLNRIQRKKVIQQKRIDEASSRLGKAFRKKICQFYNSFNDDVNYYLKNTENQKIKICRNTSFMIGERRIEAENISKIKNHKKL